MNLTLIAIACGLIAVLYGIFTSRQVLNAPAGNQRMLEVAGAIQEGASAYPRRQYTTIGIVGVVVAILVGILLGPVQAAGFVLGALLSGAAGFIGMNISVRANVHGRGRAQQSTGRPYRRVPLGRDHGMLVAGLALLAISVFFYVLVDVQGLAPNDREVIDALVALAFGASLISIFARLGGGIFTRPRTSAPTWSARSRPVSPRTIPATPP